MRDTPTEQAHRAEGAMTYHLGYFTLKEVASAKAVAVCPEGNDGLLSRLYGCILSGYLSYGRSRSTKYFMPYVTTNAPATLVPTYTASFNKSLSCLIHAATAIATGTPTAT